MGDIKRIACIVACMVALVTLSSNFTSACWIYLSVEEMQEQADLIVIGELTGDIREVVHQLGNGTTYWRVKVEHVLKGECGESLEVATGGLVTKVPAVFVSTDYRLDQYGELYLLHLSKDEEGKYSPLTPRGIVSLKRHQGGVLLGAYDVISEQHTEELSEIYTLAHKQTKAPISMVLIEAGNESQPSKLPIGIGIVIVAVATLGVTLIRK